MDRARAAVRSLTVHDARRADVVGRSARLEMVFAVRGGRTVLAHAYAEPPLRAGRALASDRGVHLILASSAPGVFGGDLFEQHVVLERGARVLITSQSATQVHPGMGADAAVIRSTFEVARDATLRCYWDPIIPFAGSRLDHQLEVRMAASARLAWSDALMAGREGRGERWRFASLGHQLRVTRGTAVEYLERYRIAPAEAPVGAAWVAGDCCYFGTALTSGWPAEVGDAERLHLELAGKPGLHASADRLGAALTLVRLAATGGPAFHEARAHIRRALDPPP